ncbi:MAG: 6-carboxytetrahydropterin synthase QueD [Fibrobacter sp.]|nr:6-carboxytetrahydropterin synthase QueD [Fibrobacter sp.]
MYKISKRFEISGAHRLDLPYDSKCTGIHGHNWIITVHCKSKELNAQGMVIDFSHVKKTIKDKLDHKLLNDIVDFNPTAENMAKWICDQIPNCYRVVVQESEGNIAEYEAD